LTDRCVGGELSRVLPNNLLKASAELSALLDQTLTKLRAIEPSANLPLPARLRDLVIMIGEGLAGIGKAAKMRG